MNLRAGRLMAKRRGVSSPWHTTVHSDCPAPPLSSHPTLGSGSGGWFYSWTPLSRPAWTWHRDRCCLWKTVIIEKSVLGDLFKKYNNLLWRHKLTSSVPHGQVVSPLELDLQLVHPWAVNRPLRRNRWWARSAHRLSAIKNKESNKSGI